VQIFLNIYFRIHDHFNTFKRCNTTTAQQILYDNNGVCNTAPTCKANGPYIAECGVGLKLDGTGSSDPENNPLTFAWTGPFTPSPSSGATPTVVFGSPTGITNVNLAVNDGEFTSSCSAVVTVQDTLKPVVQCNAPPRIVLPDHERDSKRGRKHDDKSISFTATATDVCQGSITPVITEFNCSKIGKKGKLVGKKDRCEVSIAGATITIDDVDDDDLRITWKAQATDNSGNVGTVQCEVLVVDRDDKDSDRRERHSDRDDRHSDRDDRY